MSHFSSNIRPFVEREFSAASLCMQSGEREQAFSHLENAHVLGQASTYLHVKAHVLMLFWAVRTKEPKELVGQVFRIIGAATKTVFGLVPAGNTGGANVSPFKPMHLQPEHKSIIARAKRRSC